jgi:lactate 2-monooxygenase
VVIVNCQMPFLRRCLVDGVQPHLTGRQRRDIAAEANGGLPALDCLPDVIEAADGIPVMFDSGVRSGADVIKAIALGATAVGVGRPYAYGLALGGVDGVVHVLRSLLAEADLIMAIDGYPTLADLTPDSLRHTNSHS